MDLTIIQWLTNLLPVGHFCNAYYNKHDRKKKACYRWQVVCNEALLFLETILPYLKIKKKQAEVAIEFQKNRYHHRPKKEEIPDNIERCEKVYQELKLLKV